MIYDSVVKYLCFDTGCVTFACGLENCNLIRRRQGRDFVSSALVLNCSKQNNAFITDNGQNFSVVYMTLVCRFQKCTM